jgi:hypothetical protein
VRHALILSDLGRAHAHRHAINSARTCYRDALALVVDVDEAAAQHIRDLQAALALPAKDASDGSTCAKLRRGDHDRRV